MTDDIGAVRCTPETVIDYLTHPHGGDYSDSKAHDLCVRYAHLIEQGERMASFANYVGDQIIAADDAESLDLEP